MITKVQSNHTDVYFDSFNSGQTIAGATVLDVGCGNGYASKLFLDRGADRVVSIDPYTQQLVNDRPIWLSNTQSLFTKCWGDIDSLNMKFDIIWHHHVLEHVEDCFGFLRKLRDLLTDTGVMWMACPNMAHQAVFSPGHIHNFQAPQLIDVLKRCGYAAGDASVWTLGGQLRVRIPKNGNSDYPAPMKEQLQTTGRCTADSLVHWNW